MPKELREPWGELRLKHLVYESGKDFIVYVDDDFDLEWAADDAYLDKNREQYNKSLGIINAAANTEALPSANLSPHDRLKFKRLVGEAIARGLLFDTFSAEQMITTAREFNQARNREVSRYWQLNTCGGIIAIAIVIGFAVWFNPGDAFGPLVRQKNFTALVLAGIAGMVGAFFSIASRMANLGTESGSSLSLHIAESVTRMFTGGISGIIGIVAVKSGLVLNILIKNTESMWNVLLVGLAAGLSERFVPTIIAKIGLPEPGAPQAPKTGQAQQTDQKAQQAQPQGDTGQGTPQ